MVNIQERQLPTGLWVVETVEPPPVSPPPPTPRQLAVHEAIQKSGGERLTIGLVMGMCDSCERQITREEHDGGIWFTFESKRHVGHVCNKCSQEFG
jgi:hypothetical protein